MFFRFITTVMLLSIADTAVAQYFDRNEDKAVISGFLHQYEDTTLIIEAKYFDNTRLHENLYTYSTTTTEGYFTLEIPLPAMQTISLNSGGRLIFNGIGGEFMLHTRAYHVDEHNRYTGGVSISYQIPYTIFLAPGDSLFFDVPYTEPYTSMRDVSVSGPGSEKNQAVIDIQRALMDVEVTEPLSKATLPEHVKFVDRLIHTVEVQLEDYKHLLDETEYRAVWSDFVIGFYQPLIRLFLREMRNNGVDDPVVQAVYQRLFVDQNITEYLLDAGDLYIANYRSLFLSMLRSYAEVQEAIRNGVLNEPGFAGDHPYEYYRMMRDFYKQHPIKERLLSEIIISRLRSSGYDEDIRRCIDDFFSIIPVTSPWREQVDLVAGHFLDDLAIGQPAYAFDLPDTSGTRVRLDDFKGKVVVKEFWFRGCLGCKLMVPALENVEHHFRHRDDVVFLSISVDNDEFNWRQGIGEFSSSGSLPLYTEGLGSGHPMLRAYQLQSFPRLILIDREGRLASVRAPDPRTEEGYKEFIMLIDHLLSE